MLSNLKEQLKNPIADKEYAWTVYAHLYVFQYLYSAY